MEKRVATIMVAQAAASQSLQRIEDTWVMWVAMALKTM
jgi:hypothetical protein